MSISEDEFELAYQKTIEANPTAKIFKRGAFDFLINLNRALARNYQRPERERETFGEILREKLNEMRFKDNERAAYKSLAGYYFSNRATKNHVLNAHRQKPKSPSPVVIKIDPDGQYRWKL